MMRAQVLKAFGGPENFVLTDVPKPVITPGKVLIRLAATSVNQIDIKIRGGLPIGPALPAVLGADVAGVIEEIGQRLKELAARISLVIVEQHLELALAVAAYAYVLDRGRVALAGPSEEVKRDPQLLRYLAP